MQKPPDKTESGVFQGGKKDAAREEKAMRGGLRGKQRPDRGDIVIPQ